MADPRSLIDSYAVYIDGQWVEPDNGRYDDVKLVPHNFTQETNQFVFTRLIYNGRIPGYYKNWYTDYPRADRHLIDVLKRLTNMNIANEERVIPINDPDLFKYPLVYSSEVEQMVLTDEDEPYCETTSNAAGSGSSTISGEVSNGRRSNGRSARCFHTGRSRIFPAIIRSSTSSSTSIT